MQTERAPLERRPLPPSKRRVSILGLCVDPPPSAPPEADRQLLSLLRRAHADGVNLFDVAGSKRPARAERVLSAAFAEPGDEVTVVVGCELVRAGATHFRDPAASLDPAAVRKELAAEVAAHRAALGARFALVLEVDPSPLPPAGQAAVLSAAEALTSEGQLLSWSYRLTPRSDSPGRSPEGGEVPLWSVELSLLETRHLPQLEARAASFSTAVLVRDPFAGGRLDGSRLSNELADRSPTAGPVDLRALQEEFAPILRLGFLTEGRRRTLAQAALLWLWSHRWTTSVLLPVPRPERWPEVRGAVAAPPLSPAELERIGRLISS